MAVVKESECRKWGKEGDQKVMKGRICKSKYTVWQMKWLYKSWTLDNTDSITRK